MRRLVVLVAFMVTTQVAVADDIVVLGRLIANEPMEYVADECPENQICLRSWWKSAVKVEETVRGSDISGRVITASMQHTSLNPQFKKSVRLFVLEPISDPERRKRLRAEYYLKSMAEPRQMFCLSKDPKESGLDVDGTYIGGADDSKIYCFELPDG